MEASKTKTLLLCYRCYSKYESTKQGCLCKKCYKELKSKSETYKPSRIRYNGNRKFYGLN